MKKNVKERNFREERKKEKKGETGRQANREKLIQTQLLTETLCSPQRNGFIEHKNRVADQKFFF